MHSGHRKASCLASISAPSRSASAPFLLAWNRQYQPGCELNPNPSFQEANSRLKNCLLNVSKMLKVRCKCIEVRSFRRVALLSSAARGLYFRETSFCRASEGRRSSLVLEFAIRQHWSSICPSKTDHLPATGRRGFFYNLRAQHVAQRMTGRRPIFLKKREGIKM